MIRNNQVGIGQRSAGNPGAFARSVDKESATMLATANGRKPLFEYVDYAVDELMHGPLSRGVANKQRRQRMAEIAEEALAEGRREFAAGILDSMQRLYAHHLPEEHSDDYLLELAGKKRTTAESREAWRQALQHIPERVSSSSGSFVCDLSAVSSEKAVDFELGRLAGPLALSGLETEYDFSPEGQV